MDLAFVTTNPGKVAEARGILAPYGIRVRPVRRELPEPQADSLEAVVRAKAAALRGGTTPQLVEDSGLFLTSLGGFPGVYSAYAYRTLGLDGILRLLRGRDRSGTFRTVAALRLGGRVRYFVGESRGTIAARPRGHGGFGFDPIFRPIGSRRTFAELPPEGKWAISHRGRALDAVGRCLARRMK